MCLLQPTCSTNAEEEEDGQREHNDGDNDDDETELIALVLHLKAFVLHLFLVELIHGIHLVQLVLSVLSIQGVAEQIDVTIEGCSLGITHLFLQNFSTLLHNHHTH